jgi:hypothetical protein
MRFRVLLKYLDPYIPKDLAYIVQDYLQPSTILAGCKKPITIGYWENCHWAGYVRTYSKTNRTTVATAFRSVECRESYKEFRRINESSTIFPIIIHTYKSKDFEKYSKLGRLIILPSRKMCGEYRIYYEFFSRKRSAKRKCPTVEPGLKGQKLNAKPPQSPAYWENNLGETLEILFSSM